ncbi:hypothetical protein MSPP1_003568 [Malassezia sp. CBS 17886]|nr:hypothetical protein MSPP1_003568 [Malassezia sp. CBS 17886]
MMLRVPGVLPSAARMPRASVPVRAFSSRASSRAPRTPPGRAAVRTMATSLTLSASMFGFFSDRGSSMFSTTESGSILREASPAAMAKQPYTLVFVSSRALDVPRDVWQSWIMYFRDAGYDCIDLNVELPPKGADGAPPQDQLAREIIGQVRDSSLQREPVIFLREKEDSVITPYFGTGGFFGRRGPFSGLVVVHPDDPSTVEAADWPKNTPILLIPSSEKVAPAWRNAAEGASKGEVLVDSWSENEGLIKEVERWLRYAGL